MVGRDKSAIFFSKNCTSDSKAEVQDCLDIHKEALAEKYLGLPMSIGHAVKETFEYLPARVKEVIGSWSGRATSCVGREILLKSVAQAIPTYSMSCFLLPADTYKKMRQAIANYWWGSSADNRHIHWLRWERLTQPKTQGGMGFRDLKLFNLAMLGKQGWRLMVQLESLCARVLKGRYYHDSDFLDCSRRKKSSHTWRAVPAGRDVLKAGLIRRLGDGSHTRIWGDHWISNHFSGRPIVTQEEHVSDHVRQLIMASGQWNEDLVRASFLPIDVDAIMRTPIRGEGEDVWAWELERHGMYLVKSACKFLHSRQQQQDDMTTASTSANDTWRRVWKLDVPPKVKVFWWRVIREFLSAKQVLHKRHVELVSICDTCGNQEESIQHVLMECTIARIYWEQTKELTEVILPVLHPTTWAQDLLFFGTARERATIICGMWSLWMHRNDWQHGKAGVPIKQAIHWVRDTSFDMWQILHPLKQPQAARGQPSWERPAPG
jgi:hypothetical protein